MPRGIELQHRTRSRLTETGKGEALVIQFGIGPLDFCIIANLPEYEGANGRQPLVYIKVTIGPNEEWTIFKNHEAEEIPISIPVKDAG